MGAGDGKGGGGEASWGHGMDWRRLRGRRVKKKTGGEGGREKGRRRESKKGEAEETNREATKLRPARYSMTRWRVDGEALAAVRPSCSLGYLPTKAGTTLIHNRTRANPTKPSQPTPEIPLPSHLDPHLYLARFNRFLCFKRWRTLPHPRPHKGCTNMAALWKGAASWSALVSDLLTSCQRHGKSQTGPAQPRV